MVHAYLRPQEKSTQPLGTQDHGILWLVALGPQIRSESKVRALVTRECEQILPLFWASLSSSTLFCFRFCVHSCVKVHILMYMTVISM